MLDVAGQKRRAGARTGRERFQEIVYARQKARLVEARVLREKVQVESDRLRNGRVEGRPLDTMPRQDVAGDLRVGAAGERVAVGRDWPAGGLRQCPGERGAGSSRRGQKRAVDVEQDD